MTVRYVLGIDVGTTALKAVALERERGIVAQAERLHELHSPYPGWAEEDPERWWTTTVETIRQLLTTIPANEIGAIGVSGMVLHHTRAHLYRAILEAVCYGFAHHLALLREAGRPIRHVVAADGGSRSRLWMQIAADVVDQPVQVVAGEAASALGSAYVATMGVGMFAEWQDITQLISQEPIYLPQKANVDRYRSGFELYRDLYRRLQSFLPEPGRLE